MRRQQLDDLADQPDYPGAMDSPSHEEIAERAFERYLERGGSDGSDFEDWLQAERELAEMRLAQQMTDRRALYAYSSFDEENDQA